MRRRRRTEPNFAAIDDAEDEFQDSAPRWRRIDAFVVLGVVLVAGAIVTNALFLQKGPHPSPIFANKQTPPAANDTVGTIILPRPRPMEPEPAKADAPAARSRADIVSDIQKELARRGFYDGVADGVYGAKTDVAIRDFERAAGLKPGSEPGEPLLQAIIRSSAKAAPVPPASVPPKETPTSGRFDPQAGIRCGTACASAPNTVSAMRMPVMPRAATAAGGRGLTIVPSGAITLMGRKYPALLGIDRSTIDRTQASAVDRVKG